MVLMNAGRNARNAASITNRPTCGGDKKAGLGPSVGWFLSSQPFLLRTPNSVPQYSFCVSTPVWPISKTIQVQKYGYRATISGSMG